MARGRAHRLTAEDRAKSLLADIDALPRTRATERRNSVSVDTDFLLAPYSVVREAASARRLSVPAFLRRAAYAMACHDLGIDLADVLRADPRVSRENGFGTDDPEGTIFGPWEIESLRGEDDAAGR